MGTFFQNVHFYDCDTFFYPSSPPINSILTLFRMGEEEGGKKAPLPVFPLLLPQMEELALKTFWLLVLTFFPHWCKISSLYLVPVPNYRTWTKTTPQKKWFFWSDPYKLEVMINSLIEMLELPNFGHITTSTI